ncbi:hypothetical protein PV04_09426 [Phialophora macrospora]|uniref:VWFA domain-containing protein n=1 Tax=Phialophora macrospora TaxID=1851006 RepID=A0A0D2DQN3_9EURO|nr:hypothetical protein PV04_09426 [Phialophora macrospora]
MNVNSVAGIVWDHREPFPLDLVEGFGAECIAQPPDIDVQPFNAIPEHVRQPNDHHPVHRVGPSRDFIIRQGNRNILPPLSTSLTARIIDDTAKIMITQLYWNTSNAPIHKGAYTFPLPSGCTVTDFHCRIGRDKVVKAEVKPKLQAREAFNRAVNNNQTAGLLEQDTPEIFTSMLGNIPANTKLKVEISFVTLLNHRFADQLSTTILTVPTYIAGRYGEPPLDFQTSSQSGFLRGLSVQIEVVAKQPIQRISSDTHRITVEQGVTRRQFTNWQQFVAAADTHDLPTSIVRLKEDSIFLDRDFVLEISTQPRDGFEAPHAWLEEHPFLENQKAVMLTIPPNLMLRNASSSDDGEILFVADRSGSMTSKIESLKSALVFFLKGIPQGRKFNVWCFGSEYTSLWPQSQEYSDQTLGAALTFVQTQFRANMGGTELLRALQEITRARDQSRMADVVVLTDGEVWRLDDTIDFVRKTRDDTGGQVRFFALGIGNAVSHALVEGIAKAGGGYAEVIPAASQGGWEDRVVAMLRAPLVGHLGPLKIELDTEWERRCSNQPLQNGITHPSRPRFLQSPAEISSLSPFMRNRVFMLFDAADAPASLDSINIRATAVRGSEVVTRVAVNTLERRETQIHKLGARAILGDLERGQSWLHVGPNQPLRGSAEEVELVRKEGEALGCKWSLVSKWTSFYAVEEAYVPNRNEDDPFLDLNEIQVHKADGDLDLLRQRGVSGVRLGSRVQAIRDVEVEEVDDDDNDDDEDTPSNFDSLDGPSDNSDDSDNDGDDHKREGGAAGGSAGDRGYHDQENHSPCDPSNRREGGSDRNRGDNGGAYMNPSAFHSARRRSARPGAITATSLTSAPATQEVAYHDPNTHAPPMKYPPGPQARASQSLCTNVPWTSLRSARSSNPSNARTTPSYPPKQKSFYPISGSKLPTSSHPSKPPTSSYPSKPPTSSYPSKPPTSSYRSKLPTSSDLLKPPTSSYPAPNSSSLPPIPKTSTSSPLFGPYLPSIPSLSSPTDTTKSYLPSISALCSSADATKFKDDLDCPGWSSIFSEDDGKFKGSAITSPFSNVPASVSLLYDPKAKEKSPKQLTEESVVKDILCHQEWDGSFKFDNDDQIKQVLGEAFFVELSALRSSSPFAVRPDLLLAAAVVAFLELKLSLCADLWSQVVDKARRHIFRECYKHSDFPGWPTADVDLMSAASSAMRRTSIPESQVELHRLDSGGPLFSRIGRRFSGPEGNTDTQANGTTNSLPQPRSTSPSISRESGGADNNLKSTSAGPADLGGFLWSQPGNPNITAFSEVNSASVPSGDSMSTQNDLLHQIAANNFPRVQKPETAYHPTTSPKAPSVDPLLSGQPAAKRRKLDSKYHSTPNPPVAPVAGVPLESAPFDG